MHVLSSPPTVVPQNILTVKTLKFIHQTIYYTKIRDTSPKPVGHGYVFSMTVGIIEKWLKLVPFLLGDEQLILSVVGAGSF